MAILFSQSDGSDQHYDTYEEFEQAMILMKRLNGEEVPQDLLDEVKDKHGGDKLSSINLELGGVKFESAVKEASRGLEEVMSSILEDRDFVSEESLKLRKGPKFEVGDKVKVVHNTSSGHVDGTIGKIIRVKYVEEGNRWSYEVLPMYGHIFKHSLRHRETDLEFVSD